MFFGIAALFFAACTSGTILACTSMSDMGEIAMPGGWTMSMLWMRMPGETWLNAGAAFLGMWTVMMAAMMLPSLAPLLWRSVESLGLIAEGCVAGATGQQRGVRRDPGRLAMLVAAGYFSVWIALGAAVFLLGVALAKVSMGQPEFARAVPVAIGLVVLTAGALQFTSWKARHLALCRRLPCSWQVSNSSAVSCGQAIAGGVAVRIGSAFPKRLSTALRCGLRLGIHCTLCSAGSTAVLLALGLMDLRVMAAVTVAITVERLGPAAARIAHAIGAATLVAGLVLIISAV